jgi:hypothetical protein
VVLDADHLAAEQVVLLDEQAIEAALLQQRGSREASGPTADHDHVVISIRNLLSSFSLHGGTRHPAGPRDRS